MGSWVLSDDSIKWTSIVLLALVSIEIEMKVPMVPIQVAPIRPPQWPE